MRRTRNARDRVAEARRTLGVSVKHYEASAADEEALARTDLAIAEFHYLVDELWPAPDEDAPKRAKPTTPTGWRPRLARYGTTSASS